MASSAHPPPSDWFGTPMRPLAGGYSGETFAVGEGDDQVVLRIYARNPDRSLVDASLLRLVSGLLPVPQVIESRPAADGQPGILVVERLPGERLDLLLPTADAELRTAIGRNLGGVLATLSGIPMLGFGMFEGADLRRGGGEPGGGLAAWAHHFRDTGRLAGWREEDWAALLNLTEAAETVLEGGDSQDAEFDPARSRSVLVHSDFNPKNILVDAETGEVTGLLDWEFAHAGSPYADLGNLTRFERQPGFVEAVLGAFVERAPTLVADPLRMARAADVWALIELAGNERSNAVRELAAVLLLAQARSGDLHAWPWATPRVDPSGAKPVL